VGLASLRACLVLAAVAIGLLGACSSATTPNVISADGRVGTLRVEQSGSAAVIAFAGRPDAERRGAEFGSSRYLALGYGCAKTRSDVAFPLLEQGPYCRTVFFINARTGKLGDLYTSSDRYAESHGVRIGMRSAVAERLLRQRLYQGCETNISLGGGDAALTVAFAGGVSHKAPPGSAGLHVTGAHVFAFVLHGRRSAVGVFDCS